MTAPRKKEIRIPLRDFGKSIRLASGALTNIVVEAPTVAVDILEAEDTLFRFDSAFFLPDGVPSNEVGQDSPELTEQTRVSGLAVLKGFFRYNQLCYARGKPKKVLITGHTDSSGPSAYNEELSKKRAMVVLSLITGGNAKCGTFVDLGPRDTFVSIVSKQHTEKDLQHVLTWICERMSPYLSDAEVERVSSTPKWSEVDPGGIDGKIGRKTRDATKAFKWLFKNDFPPTGAYEGVEFAPDLEAVKSDVPETNVADKAFWAAVFELYQAELQFAMKDDGLDILQLREQLQWVEETRKATGCGETWPLENRGQDNYRSQTNRRVEILFYDPHEIIGELPCKDGTCDEGDCHIFRQIDRYQAKPTEAKLGWKYLDLTPEGTTRGEYLIKTDIHINSPGETIFTLTSSKGYACVKSSTKDNCGGGLWVHLLFTMVPINGTFSLSARPDGADEYYIFQDRKWGAAEQ